jgi:tetratricopeptide (TPR) repeat protein
MNNIKLFEDKNVRSVWNEEEQKWYFSVVDVVGILTNSTDSKDYWYRIKKREKLSGFELSTICRQLKIESSDGKKYATDCSDTQGFFRIVKFLKPTFCIFLILVNFMMQAQSNFDTAEKLFKEEKLEQAQVIFEALYKTNPNDTKTIEYLGDIAWRNKSWDKSMGYFKKLTQLKPQEANSFFKYGGALGMKAKFSNKFKALGMLDDIKASFQKCIALNPKHIEARYALVEIYIQVPGIAGGSEKKARAYAEELLKISPVDGYIAKGRIEEYYENYDKSEVQYKKAYEIGKSKTTYKKLYDLYANKMKNLEKAKALKAP